MSDPQCQICGQMRKLLVTGVWMCPKCDAPMTGGEKPTWFQKLGIDPADEWLNRDE